MKDSPVVYDEIINRYTEIFVFDMSVSIQEFCNNIKIFRYELTNYSVELITKYREDELRAIKNNLNAGSTEHIITYWYAQQLNVRTKYLRFIKNESEEKIKIINALKILELNINDMVIRVCNNLKNELLKYESFHFFDENADHYERGRSECRVYYNEILVYVFVIDYNNELVIDSYRHNGTINYEHLRNENSFFNRSIQNHSQKKDRRKLLTTSPSWTVNTLVDKKLS